MLETLKEALNQINASEPAADQLKDLTALNQLLIQKIEEDESNLNQVNFKFLTKFRGFDIFNFHGRIEKANLKKFVTFIFTLH